MRRFSLVAAAAAISIAAVGGVAVLTVGGIQASPDPSAAKPAAAKSSSDRLCTGYPGVPSASDGKTDGPEGMVWVGGGSFRMGSGTHYPEERPPRDVTVGGFWIDRHEVTNAQFARFVAATGYKTVAERGLDPKEYPDLPPEALVPGSMVFQGPVKKPNPRTRPMEWWLYVPGADWQHPTGPQSKLSGKDNHPAVHLAYADARAYAEWLGRSLPTEAEWEFAARGGLNGKDFAWGDEQTPEGKWMANSWQGFFPYQDDTLDGHHGTAPVGCYEPNGYGLYDMIGNVWEWASDWYRPGHGAKNGDVDPTGPAGAADGAGGPVRVIKGGSWLCAPNFCARYRPAARQPQEADLGASHVGFRTVLRADKRSSR